MADDTHEDHDEHGGHADEAVHANEAEHADEREYETLRTTAPQSPYTTRDVGVGALIAAVGILLVFVVPYLLA